MRAVIQRVLEASVKVSGETIASIPSGLLVLLGIEEDDLEEDILWLSGKISRLRIFNDAEGIMNLSILDTDKDILVISQFTLHASTKKGNRPSYLKSANPEFSEPFFEKFISQLNIDLGKNVYEGIFGADMKVSLINDDPVTILIDTKNKE